MSEFDEFMPDRRAAYSQVDRPPRDGTPWSLIIVTMVFLAYGIWSGYQIHQLWKPRIEISELRSEVDNHKVELSKLQVHLLDEAE